MNETTMLLQSIEQGDAQAAEKLLTPVYTELRRLAACKMNNEAAGQALQLTALVHEAWLRFFLGLNIAELAEILRLTERTAKCSWAYARA